MDDQIEQTDLIEAALPPCVFCAAIGVYDRYCEVAIKVNDIHMLSFPDFINELLVRQMIEHSHVLARFEKKLGIT